MDNNTCFIHLNLPFHPLKYELNFYLNEENEKSKLYGIDYLNPELVDFFNQSKIFLKKKWLLIIWQDKKQNPPHSDGFRKCGINWNFTPNTSLEFYSNDNAESFKINEDPENVFWRNLSSPIAVWNTAGPVLINTSIPHGVSLNSKKRITCSLSFYQDYDTLKSLLREYIVL